MEGVTGRLSLSPEGRIERQLNWARVSEGAIVPADPGSP
jgi:outer membrane PBP1 activator LpoA protein